MRKGSAVRQSRVILVWMDESEELRWPLGDAVMANSKWVPGGFIFVYAGVIGWKWCARAVRRGYRRLRPEPLLRLPPPLKALPPPRAEGPGATGL